MESWPLPPPSTCYGFLLSLVGEGDRTAHLGVRVTSGLLNRPDLGMVLRTIWRIKDRSVLPGVGSNQRPDFQQLYTKVNLVIWVDSSEEPGHRPTLEQRVRQALEHPESVERFGGLSLGESTHLVNDVTLVTGDYPVQALTFLLKTDGRRTYPVWVDHIAGSGTRYATGDLKMSGQPERSRLPRILSPPAPR